MYLKVDCDPSRKSVILAYVLWLFGGIFGVHHFYLRRDRHAFVWWTTLGGFGVGWLFEVFRIPRYVRDANEEHPLEFRARMQQNRKVSWNFDNMWVANILLITSIVVVLINGMCNKYLLPKIGRTSEYRTPPSGMGRRGGV